MLESDNIMQCNMVNSNTQNNYNEFNKGEYIKKYIELLTGKGLDLLIKFFGVFFELGLLENLQQYINNTELNYTKENIFIMLVILYTIEADKFLLNYTDELKQELEIIKQTKPKMLKKLSKTKNYIG